MFDGDLGGALLAAAERHAERPALQAAGQRLTYAELFDSAARIAAAIEKAGVPTGERVAILCQRTPTAYASVIGTLLAGCTYVPLNTQYSKQRNGAILGAADAAALVLDEASAVKLDEHLDVPASELVLVRPEAAGRSDDAAVHPEGAGADFWRAHRRSVGRDGTAYVLFTSGTTGVPKGVPISHSNVAAYVAGLSAVEPLTSDDRLLHYVDLTFDISVHDMFMAWLNGAELYVLPENAGWLAPRMISQNRITSCFLVPSVAAYLLERRLAKAGAMPSLRVSYFCGEALPRTAAAGWSAAAPNSRIVNLYGPTEATVAFSYHEYDPEEDAEFSVVPIGKPLRDQRIALFDPGMVEAKPGEFGQICLSGSQVMAGYWRNPAVDAEKFATVDGVRWYKTGDLGRWIEPIGFVFAGRADRQVKLRGFLVELQEIEGLVRRLTGRQQVAVIAWPLRAPGSADGSVAFISGEEADADEIRAGCRTLGGEVMTPDRIVFVPNLPVNSNGKVDYNVLAQHPSLSA